MYEKKGIWLEGSVLTDSSVGQVRGCASERFGFLPIHLILFGPYPGDESLSHRAARNQAATSKPSACAPPHPVPTPGAFNLFNAF